MSWVFAIAIYFIIWWTTLFAVLPFGVRTQEEAGEVVPGTPESAPAKPGLLRVFALTTGIASLIFVLVYAIIVWKVVNLGDWLPDPTKLGRPGH